MAWRQTRDPRFRSAESAAPASPYSLSAFASLELAANCRRFLHRHPHVPLVALDLAGAERGFPASHHAAAFRWASSHCLGRTVHAGEADGPLSIWQAVDACQAHRIGHGTHLF